MAPFVARANYIAIASEESILFIDSVNGTAKNIDIPRLHQDVTAQPKPVVDSSTNKNGYDECSHISTGTCLAFSQCITYLAAVTTDKNLTIWKTSNQELVRQFKTARKVSSLTFTNDVTMLVVADKAGDCYIYSMLLPNENDGKLILGHLSMLLDVVVTPDQRFVITSERDEKIRVSCFPNSYNIHTFLLGHQEFVTALYILPGSTNMLLSGSGDGTLRMWNYADGKMVHVENIRGPGDDDMEKAVRSVTVFHVGEALFITAVLLNKSNSVLLYKINGIENIKFESQTLPFLAQPLAASFTGDGNLFVLTDDSSHPIQCFAADSDLTYTLQESLFIGNLLSNETHLKIIQDSASSCNGDLKPLYKRWFDNVQMFRERKEEMKNKKPKLSETSCSPKRQRVD